VAEHLHDDLSGSPRTLFATHYHELTHLARDLDRVVNLNVLVREWNDEVHFMHRIVPGAADRSYGIHVARLAGLPDAVLRRAREVLKHLEEGRLDRVEMSIHDASRVQLELFTPVFEEWREELRRLDVDRMTPVDALQAIDRLKRKYAGTGQNDENSPGLEPGGPST
jgi:DNA mismatch repair protein MutS